MPGVCGDRLMTRRVERIDQHAIPLDRPLFVEDGVRDGLPPPIVAPHLENPGVGGLRRVLGDLDPLLPTARRASRIAESL